MAAKILQIKTISVHPSDIEEIIQHGPAKAEKIKKLNGRLLGIYKSVIGAHAEIVMLVEYDSFQARIEGLKGAHKDQPSKKTGEKAKKAHIEFTKSVEFYPVHYPAKSSYIAIRKTEYKGGLQATLHSLKPAMDPLLQKYLEPNGMHLFGIFYTVFGHKANTVTWMHEIPQGKTIDQYQSLIEQLLKDGQHNQEISNLYANVIGMDYVIYEPAWTPP